MADSPLPPPPKVKQIENMEGSNETDRKQEKPLGKFYAPHPERLLGRDLLGGRERERKVKRKGILIRLIVVFPRRIKIKRGKAASEEKYPSAESMPLPKVFRCTQLEGGERLKTGNSSPIDC